MRSSPRRPARTAASALLVLPLALTGSAALADDAPKSATATATAACSPASTIEKKLPGGTTWRMCWRNSPTAGLVLEGVSYRPKHESKPIQVLASARLAQINVPYDTGSVEYNDLTEMEFGTGLLPLAAKDCPGGSRRTVAVEGYRVKGLCVTTRPRGFAYYGGSGDIGEDPPRTDRAQGRDLVVYTITEVGYYRYITQWNFSDDGTITAQEGATGNLSDSDYDAGDRTGWPIGEGSAAKAASHHHNVSWRLDFRLDGSPKTRVEQYDTRQTGVSEEDVPVMATTRKRLTEEFAGDAANSRWWRVVSATGRNEDGHRRSWEIAQQHSDKYGPHDWTEHDVYVTQYRACEKYASDNKRFDPDCKDTVADYVSGERLTHPVVWVNVGFHHIARDEDQTPMPVHWQGFRIVPRDVTAMSPLTPEHLHKPRFNGEPHR